MADKRPDTYLEDGKRIWRASSYGKCDNYLVKVAMGMTPEPPPDRVLAGMGDGVEWEDRVLKKLSTHGWDVLDHHRLGVQYGPVGNDGQVQAELAVPGGTIRCHPDGIAQKFKGPKAADGTTRAVGTRRVVEVKVLKRGTSDPLDRPFYAWQFAIEMASVGLGGLYVVAWKDVEEGEDGERVVDVDVDNLWVREIDPGDDPRVPTLGQIKARAAKLNRLVKAAEDGDGHPPCDQKMWPCGFWQLHDTETGVWADDTETLESDDIAALIARYKNTGDEIKRLEAVKKELRGEIEDAVGGEGKFDVVGRAGRWTVNVTTSHVAETTRVVKAHDRTTVSVREKE